MFFEPECASDRFSRLPDSKAYPTFLGLTYQAEQGVVTVHGLRLSILSLRSLSNNYIVGVLPITILICFLSKDIYFVAYIPYYKRCVPGVCINFNLDMDMNSETILYRYDRFKRR